MGRHNYSLLLMTRKNFLKLATVALLLGGCSNYDRRLNDKKTSYLGTDGSIIFRSSASTLADKNSYWDGDGVDGAPSIIISLSEQTASFY